MKRNILYPYGVNTEQQNGKAMTVSLEKWHSMELYEKDALKSWGFSYSPEQVTEWQHHYSGMFGRWKEQAFSYPLWVLGAVPCHYERLKGKYRYRVILKCKNTSPYRTLIRAVLEAVTAQKAFAKLYLYADMNGDIGV